MNSFLELVTNCFNKDTSMQGDKRPKIVHVHKWHKMFRLSSAPSDKHLHQEKPRWSSAFQVVQLLFPLPAAGTPPHSHSLLQTVSSPTPHHSLSSDEGSYDCQNISFLVKRYSQLLLTRCRKTHSLLLHHQDQKTSGKVSALKDQLVFQMLYCELRVGFAGVTPERVFDLTGIAVRMAAPFGRISVAD